LSARLQCHPACGKSTNNLRQDVFFQPGLLRRTSFLSAKKNQLHTSQTPVREELYAAGFMMSILSDECYVPAMVSGT
jgi:hypothetical protein